MDLENEKKQKNICSNIMICGFFISTSRWMRILLQPSTVKKEPSIYVGIKITYQTKENGTLICLLTSEVFLSMVHLHQDLLACTNGKDFETVEL